MGSAQRLSNGNYHFSVTVQDDNSPKAQAIEVTPAGKIAYVMELPQAGTYRSNRLADLYTPPNR